MSIRPFVKLFRHGQLSAALGLKALLKPFYRLSYLVAAKDSGVLDLLSRDPVPFEALANTFCSDAKGREALEAWLHLGVRLGLLVLDERGYALRGLARKLARPENDATMALAQEVAGLHRKLILHTPRRLRDGKLWELGDQDGELIARSSRALEVFQTEAIDRTFPRSGELRLLEIGCGSAFYIKYAATNNPSLSALGLELQPEVADVARRNIRHWNLQERVTVETGDIRRRMPAAEFDIATLYNNIYYFPVDERAALLAHVRKFIRPGGFLLLTSCCQGGNLGMELLNLWGAATATGGRLPRVDEMVGQLNDAGYVDVQAIRLIPGDRFYAFRAAACA